MQCGYKFCKEKTGEGSKEICDHNFIKDNGKKDLKYKPYFHLHSTGPESGGMLRNISEDVWCEVK